jgi:hypothetical protein
MPDTQTPSLARQLVSTNTAYFPNENTVYRTARNALLVEEIELRRHIERVAAQRRALPQGGEVRTTTSSSPRRAPFPSPAYLAIKTR